MSCCGGLRGTINGAVEVPVPVPVIGNANCCPTTCATVETTGDVLVTVPEFDTPVADLQLVELTITGYVIKTTSNVNGLQGGFIYMRAMARRFDADDVFPGLVVLFNDFTLQSVSAGLGILPIATGNTLQIQLDGAAGDYRWDLQMNACIIDQEIDVIGGGG